MTATGLNSRTTLIPALSTKNTTSVVRGPKYGKKEIDLRMVTSTSQPGAVAYTANVPDPIR